MARIVLTQPLPRIKDLADSLVRRGHDVLSLPFLRIEPRSIANLSQRLQQFDYVIAVSPAAIEVLSESLAGNWPVPGPRLGLIGPGSLGTLSSSGLRLSAAQIFHPSVPPYDANSLIGMTELRFPDHKAVLVVRGEGGKEEWIETLRARGARVDVLALYDRVAVEPASADRVRLEAWLQSDTQIYCALTQTAALQALCKLPQSRGLVGAGGRGVALAIHERIAKEAQSAGFNDVRLIEPGESAIVAAIE